MNTNNRLKSTQQAGSVLLEALIAVLIFSMGVLSVVAMQAKAVQAASDAKYRSDASLLAGEFLGQMWTSDRVNANLVANFQGGSGADGQQYKNWIANVAAALPGVATGLPANTASSSSNLLPTVTIDASSVVTIVVFWKLPSDTGAAHKYTIIAQVR